MSCSHLPAGRAAALIRAHRRNKDRKRSVRQDVELLSPSHFKTDSQPNKTALTQKAQRPQSSVQPAAFLHLSTVIPSRDDGVMPAVMTFLPLPSKRTCFQIRPAPVDPTSPGQRSRRTRGRSSLIHAPTTP